MLRLSTINGSLISFAKRFISSRLPGRYPDTRFKMKKEQYGNTYRVTIHPGEFYSTNDTAVVSTLLGSCIAACLYDPKRRVIGMNHFLLSSSRYSKEMPLDETEAGRYGMHAMELLINDMMAKGTNRSSLRAKIFGGASIIGKKESSTNFFCVGQVNCRFIREYLTAEGIPVDAEDLGGNCGRVIHFSNGDFSVHRRKISPDKSGSLARRDRQCWQKSLDNQKKAQLQIELW
jgi:chemotaxis protein CheD